MSALDHLSSFEYPGTIHATAIAAHERGVLLIGPSGSGKSSLALQMMALGAELISDDMVWLFPDDAGRVHAGFPPDSPIVPQIEARGIGMLAPPTISDPLPVSLIVNLSEVELQRLPEPKTVKMGAQDVLCLHKVENPAFPSMVMEYLRAMSGSPT